MKWIRFFSSFDGRIGRKMFWLMSVAVVAVELFAAVLSILAAVLLSIDDWWIEVILIAFLYPKFVVDVKRGHDRNISLWVIAALYAAYGVRTLLIKVGWLVTLPNQNVMSLANVISFIMTILLGIFSLALFVELGFRKGTPGPNRYGPVPAITA